MSGIDQAVDDTTVLDEDDLRDVKKEVTLLGCGKTLVERFGKPTWRKLVKAVEEHAGGNNRALAEKIARNHPVLRTQFSTSPGPLPQATPPSNDTANSAKHIPREKTYTFPAEDIKFLEILDKLGKLKEVSYLLASCEVSVAEQCVKFVGTPDETRQARGEIQQILEHAERKAEPLPEFVSSQIVGEYTTKCMEMNEGVLVQLQQKEILFIANNKESHEKANKWLEAHAYPAALEFKERGGRYVHTSVKLPGSTPVEVKEVTVCTEYLHPPDHDSKVPLYFAMKLCKKAVSAIGKKSLKSNLPWCSDLIYRKMKGLFWKLQPYQASLKVGYEIRFGHVLWKLGGSSTPREKWTLDQFTIPQFQQNSLHSRFFARVHPDVQEVLSEYIHDLHLSANLLDPLRLEVTRHDGTTVKCVAVIKESEDEGFILKNVYHDQRAKGRTPQFDIVLPEKKYDIRIAPNFAPVVEQCCDAEVREIVDCFISSIHRRPDGTGTLLMKVRGPNHRVKFVRQKKQTQYQWKANEKWILAIYHVQEFEISDDPDKIKEWPLDEKVELQLKKPKTEIELWNQKLFGDFADRSHFVKSDYEAVKSTKDIHVRGEYDPRKGFSWTAEKMMEDFQEFVATAVHITDLLPGSNLTE